MKPTAVIAIALLSFCAGWLIKPSPQPDSGETATGKNPAGISSSKRTTASDERLDGKTRIREPRPLVLKARPSGSIDTQPETAAAQARFQETFGSAAERAENARLARLVEALGLSPDQRATMALLLTNRSDGFRDFQGAKNPAESIRAAGVAEQQFMEDVKRVLDAEQVFALEDFKQREKSNSIEARAQRGLADLIGQVDLSEAQREQALEVMREQSEIADAKRPPGWAIMNEGRGIVSANQAAVLDELGGIMDDPSILDNPQEVQRRLAEAQRASAQAKLTALSNILTPGQLSQLRATLEARTTMMEQFTPPAVTPR